MGDALQAPWDAVEIYATGGIVMPGMIEIIGTWWKTATRGTCSTGKCHRAPRLEMILQWATRSAEDIYAGNCCRRSR